MNPETLLALSQLYERMWRGGTPRLNRYGPTTFALAMDRATRAARLDPTGWSYQNQLARLYELQWTRQRRGDLLDECIKLYREAYKLFPSNPTLAVNLARQYERKRNRTAALNMYRTALELDKFQYHHERRRLKPTHRRLAQERVRALEKSLESAEPRQE